MKTNLILGLLALAQLIAALLTQVVIVRIVGTGADTDAYVAALAIPLVLHSILAIPLQNVWLPRIMACAPDDRADSVRQALGQAFTWFGAAALVLSFTAPVWVVVLFPGLAEPQRASTEAMIRIMLAGTLFSGMLAILTVVGRSRKRFFVVEAVPLMVAILALVAITPIVSRTGVEGAALIFTLRCICACLALWLVLKVGWPRLGRGAEKSAAFRSARPLLLGSAVYKVGPLVDRFWTSQSPPGTMTIFNLATAATGAATMVIERAFSTPVIPSLSEFWQRADIKGFRRAYRRPVVQSFVLVIGGFGLLLLFDDFAIDLIRQLLLFSHEDATQMIHIAYALAGTVFAGAAGTAVAGGFYASGDTLTPVRIGVAGFLVGLVLKGIGFMHHGVDGLAVATSIYYVGNLIVMVILLERRLNEADAGARRP